MENNVKNTKEVVVGFLAIATMLAESFKDGVQVADFAVIMAKIAADADLKAKLEAAYADIELVKNEVADISLVEGLEIVEACVPEIKKLMVAVKK